MGIVCYWCYIYYVALLLAYMNELIYKKIQTTKQPKDTKYKIVLPKKTKKPSVYQREKKLKTKQPRDNPKCHAGLFKLLSEVHCRSSNYFRGVT